VEGFTSPRLGEPDERFFSPFALATVVTADLPEIQAVVDALVGPFNFFVASNGVLIQAGSASSVERQSDILGPRSQFLISAIGFNPIGRIELLTLAVYSTDPSNTVGGGDLVARQAEIKWDIEQEESELKVKLNVQGEDGFSINLIATGGNVIGVRQKAEPPPPGTPFPGPGETFPIRLLTDGLGGTSIVQGTQWDRIDAEMVLEPSNAVYFPQTEQVLNIGPPTPGGSGVFRSLEVANKIEAQAP
jgi:hypothetical protein